MFTYDYMGRRVRKTVLVYDNSAWQGLTDQLFVYDRWNVVEVLDANASNNILSKYTWGLDMSGQAGTDGTSGIYGAGGISGLLASVETGTTGSPVHWYFYDANGNIGQVLLVATNPTTITTVARYEYDQQLELDGEDPIMLGVGAGCFDVEVEVGHAPGRTRGFIGFAVRSTAAWRAIRIAARL